MITTDPQSTTNPPVPEEAAPKVRASVRGLPAPVVARRARGCGCQQPWRDDDTCLRCGRRVPPATRHAPRQRRSALEGNPWTAAGIVRALRTHAFFVGRPPTSIDWSFEDDRGWPSVSTVVQLFGSFEAAVAASLSPPTERFR